MNRAIELLSNFCCVALLYRNNSVPLLPEMFHSPIADERNATQQCLTRDTLVGNKKNITRIMFLIAVLVQAGIVANAQQRLSFDAAYDTALRNNLQLRSNDIQIQRSRTLQNTWLDIPKTGVFAETEDANV